MALYILIVLVVVSLIWTIWHRPKSDDFGTESDKQAKLREFVAMDIRACGQYCYWYLALIGVCVTIAAGNRTYFGSLLNWSHLWPFVVAFVAASLGMLFVPAGYGAKRFNRLRMVWVRSILCEQAVVLFTCYGLWKSFLFLATTAPK